jgi:small subunit ribosomal protein S2
MATEVDIKKLLEVGAHFGHKTSRWHPKMSPFIHSKRNGSHIIDLTKTVEKLEEALEFIEKAAGQGKQILLVGTKRQAKEIIKKTAADIDMPYVVERWVGGMLTNTATMNGRIKHLKDLETKMDSGALEAKYNKLEVQRYQEEIDQLNFLYGGIKHLSNKPGVLFVVDIKDDINAVREARKLHIPVVAIADTNSDPSLVDYAVPANDDAIKTIELITGYVAQAIQAGKQQHAKKSAQNADKEKAQMPKHNTTSEPAEEQKPLKIGG